MSSVESVNVGVLRAMEATTGVSGIDKRPTSGAVWVASPAPGTSGVAGDPIGDPEHHGGLDRAVYAYAREDLDAWRPTLGDLRAGAFGENLTTRGLEVTHARIGERWRVGADLVLEVAVPRIPCRTFAAWLEVQGWVKTFTRTAVPGAYLRVVSEGAVQAGDPVVVEHRPDHDVTIGLTFRAMTSSRTSSPACSASTRSPTRSASSPGAAPGSPCGPSAERTGHRQRSHSLGVHAGGAPHHDVYGGPVDRDRRPTHEGRPLPRPTDDLEDQGLAFDLGTLGRRRMLRVLGLGAVAVGVAACGGTPSAAAPTTAPGEIPDERRAPTPATGRTARTCSRRAASSAATSARASAGPPAWPRASP